MSFLRNTAKTLIALLACGAVTACVGTSFPLLGQWGDRVALGSQIVCETPGTASRTIYQITEVRSDDAPSTFHYLVHGRLFSRSLTTLTLVFKETEDPGVYLVETQAYENGPYQHFWFDEEAWTGMVLEENDAVQDAALRNNVQIGKSLMDAVVGEAEDVRAFIDDLGSSFTANAVCYPMA